MADVGPVSGEVIVKVGFAEVAHGEAGLADMSPDRLAPVIKHGGGEEAVGLAAQGQKLGACLIWRGGLGEGCPFEIKHLIAAKDQAAGAAAGDPGGLHLGQGIGDVAGGGAFGFKALADGFLIDARSLRRDVKPRVAQELEADGRGGGEDQGAGHGCG